MNDLNGLQASFNWADVGFHGIDYHFATPKLAALARREAIYIEKKFSDHAPLTIDYDFSL